MAKKKEEAETIQPKKRATRKPKAEKVDVVSQVEAEAPETVHPAILETATQFEEGKSEKTRDYITKPKLEMTDIERQRARAQAEALWMMYREGELFLQDLEIPANNRAGYIRKTVLYSHKSAYSI